MQQNISHLVFLEIAGAEVSSLCKQQELVGKLVVQQLGHRSCDVRCIRFPGAPEEQKAERLHRPAKEWHFLETSDAK